ncbi:MAG: Y4bD/Y4pK family protein [Actinobacteria bacterium]|nr:Y4bD/Y4pK family protein [Actinomycetota bacterium]
MTHPFHPLAGREFEFVKRRRNWQLDRVYFVDDAGELVSLPAEWTDAVAADPFVVVAAGRSPFHLAGLLELSELVARLTAGRSSERPPGVKRTMP